MFLIQSLIIGIDFVLPETTMTERYEEDFKDLDIPLTFRVCLKSGFDQEKLLEAGYKSDERYFFGQSKVNDSVFGWTGHYQNTENENSAEGAEHAFLSLLYFLLIVI